MQRTITNTLKTAIIALTCMALLSGPLVTVAATSVESIDGANVRMVVMGCNNNNICEANLGENSNNCSNDCVAPNPNGVGSSAGPSGGQILIVSDIAVATGVTSVVVSWKTNRVAVGTLAWGKTADYELGTVSEIGYMFNHSVKIENLLPNQAYFFKIDNQDTRMVITSIKGLGFTTLPIPDVTPPANVTGLSATMHDDAVQLTWQNPTDTDFDVVRVMRLTTFFPRDPYDGKVVYEGRGVYFIDANVTAGTTYHYAAFTRDTTGNYSSGAVISVSIPKKNATSTTPVITTEPFPGLPTIVSSLHLTDFGVSEKGNKKSFSQNLISIEGHQTVVLSIDYDKLAENLKTIAVTVEDPTDEYKKSTYLLHINKDKTAYEATIGGFDDAGTYNFVIAVLDYKTQTLEKVQGAFVVPRTLAVQPKKGISAFNWIDLMFPLFILLLILIALVLAVRLIVQKMRKGKRAQLTKRRKS